MNNIRKSVEDNYPTFITIAAATVAGIALVIWMITFFVKKVKNNPSTETS